MSITIATRLAEIIPPATHAISAKAKAMQAQGKAVISLSIGEPDFNTPEPVKQAAVKAIADNHSHYTPVNGIPALLDAISAKLTRENQLDYAPSQIMVCNGVKQALYNLAQALLNPGDEVLIPAPYWVSYPDIIKLTGATPIYIPTSMQQQFKLMPQQLSEYITDRTKLIILNSPNNPSGMVYSIDEWQALAEVLLKHPQVCIASDDIYEHIAWVEAPYSNIINACPQLMQRTVVMNGLSKSFAMTGWRMGYAAGPKVIIDAMSKIQAQSTSGINSITQHAAIEALNGSLDCVRKMRDTYKKRYQNMYQALSAMRLIKCIPSQGAFYILADVSEAMLHHDCATDIELADKLLSEALVATIPGSAFGAPGMLRFSFATEERLITQAMQQLIPFLNPV